MNGGDCESKDDCGDDVDCYGGGSNDGDSVDDGGGANINVVDDANCNDVESIVHCGENKDGSGGPSIDDVGVDTKGYSDLDFGNEKTKVGCIEDTTGVNGNSNDNGSPDDADDVGNNDN